MNETDIRAWKEQYRQNARANALLLSVGREDLVSGLEDREKKRKGFLGAAREDLKRAALCARRIVDPRKARDERFKREEAAMRESGYLLTWGGKSNGR